jgi:hypothetical protein
MDSLGERALGEAAVGAADHVLAPPALARRENALKVLIDV